MKSIVKWPAALLITVVMAVAVHAQADKRVANISAKVAEINKASSKYKRTKKDVLGISTEGAEATIYRSGAEIKRITAKIYGETYNAVSEFYFSGGKVIFSYDRVNHYDTQIGLAKPVKVVRVEQLRGYFDEGKMIRYLKGKKVVSPKLYGFSEYEGQVLSTIKGILDEET